MKNILDFVQPCNWGSTRFRGVVLVLLLSNRIRCAGLLGVFGLLASSSFAGGPHGAAKVKQLSVPSAQKKLNQASARFIENSGQWPEKALFLARSQNLNVWMTHKGVTYDYFQENLGKKDSARKGQVITMSFKGGSALTPVGTGSLGYKTQYIKATGKVHHNAGNFSGVVAKNIYPGVDLHSYYDHEKPRYDLVVAPQANASVIRLNFHGADKATVSGNTIQLGTQIGTLSQGKLFAYQLVSGKKQRVAADFVDYGKSDFGFKLGAYDHAKPLIIDPLVYGSYYGGDGGFDSVNCITTDNAGGVYMTGYTLAPDFPAIDGPYGYTIHGGKDAFVAKLQGDAFNEDYSAYVGGSLDDNAQFISVDPFGDVWIAGRTQSSDFPGNENYQRPNVQYLQPSGQGTVNFPPTGGTFQITYGTGNPSVPIPFNASPLEVQSVINTLLPVPGAQVTAVPTGQLLSQGASYRIALPWNDPLLLTVTNNLEGTSYVLSLRVAGQAVEIAPNGGTNPTAGTYTVSFIQNDMATFTTAPLAFNANAAQIQAACNKALNAPAGDNYVKVQAEAPGGGVPPVVLSFVGVGNPYTNLPPSVGVNSSGLTGGTFVTNQVERFALAWNQLTSAPTGGTFDLEAIASTGSGVVQLNYNANAATVQAAMQGIVGANNCVTDVEPTKGTDTSLPDVTILITFCGKLANSGVEMGISNGLFPQPSLAFATKTTDIFVMRFKQSSTTVLDPLVGGTETDVFFGGDFEETLAGFSIRPESNPATTDPVLFAFGGAVTSAVPEISGTPTGPQSGYVAKYSYSNGAFTIDPLISRYVSGGNSIDLNGVAMDSQGSVYSGGTVHYTGNVDTSQTPGSSVFTTTAGVFANGRLLRNDDLFIQKYTSDGNLAYSALIGGNDYDDAGGLDTDNDGTVYNTGSTIAVDSNLDLYITGVSGSFDYPRTRGVYGEVFTNAANVVVTKVNTDASQILYSTNLQTSGAVNPGGIAVDLRGDAFITGNIHPDWVDFADTFTFNPANAGSPNVPTSQPLGTIQVTSDALVGSNSQPTTSGALATVKGFLNILDPAADSLLYGTYLGGALDDRVFAPYVDSFGDVWVFGWVETYRSYTLYDSSGNPHVYTDFGAADGSLPSSMISPLAFKSVPDAFGYTTLNGILYGALSQTYPLYTPWSFAPTTTNPGYPLATIQVTYKMDGWLDKLRVGLASVQSVTLSPSTVPGGLGASTTGTVTLSQAAPNGGADIVLTLLNNTTAASFSSASPSASLVITIPAGATTGTFTVYTEGVTVNTPVSVQAAYQGTFQIGLFTVTPWLQQLSLTPTSVVGGNTVTGRITLATVPPTGSGGVNVKVLTDSPTLVSFPGGATVNVPEGQTSVTFQISTSGVGVITYPQITASLLGVGITQTLTLELASLSTLSFIPASVAGGTPSTGTLTLNGQATGPFVVNLSSANSNYTFADATTGAPITTITFNSGDSQKSFTVLTPYVSASSQDVITATCLAQGNYPLQSISATLFTTAADITGLTVTPAEVAGGGTSQGTIVINTAAPTGGVVVNLSTSNSAVAQVPTTVTIPAGATSAVFTITTTVIASQASVTIIATRGSVKETAPLTVDGVSFGLSLSPQSVVGGSTGTGSAGGTSTGTITLTSAAPASGLSFNVSIPSAYSQYAFFGTAGTNTVTAFVPGNATTGTFTINTAIVPSEQEIPVSAFVHGQTTGGEQATLEVRVAGVTSVKFSPSTIRGRGAQVTFCTITLDSPAPTGGLTVTLSQTTPLLNLGKGSFTIPAGSTSLKVPTGFTAIGVSRSLSTVVTATPSNGGNGASAIVIVTR